MKGDPEYAAAMSRLRTRECTYDDVDLFNSNIILSAAHENGIDMHSPEENSATSIVDTNATREILNLRKAQTNCVQSNKSLIMCGAVDRCLTKQLTESQHHKLLNLDFLSTKVKQSLPGFLPLYEGMPVVLRTKNLSTDLGITNGAQGILKSFYMGTTISNRLYCKSAIVHFPRSQVLLPGLDRGDYPILPVSATFTTQLPGANNTIEILKIRRSQLPFQPGFSVTGHSAQGKTLPKVIASLHKGGFASYVAASRAQTRNGLRITPPVVLADLNKSLPHALTQEVHRLNALERNTLIKHNFSTGILSAVPDPESEVQFKSTNFKAKFPIVETKLKSNGTKRKDNQDFSPNDPECNKHFQVADISTDSAQSHLRIPPSSGCSWSSIN